MTEPLSPRQLSVLAALAAGDTVDQAAGRLLVSSSTAKKAIEGARAKLGARSTAHAVALAYEAGILPVGEGR